MSGRFDHDNSSYIQALFYFCFVCACYTESVKKFWICKNHPKSQELNPIYCWTLNLHTCTTQKHQTHGYMWPSLLSQMVFANSVKLPRFYYRVCGASEWLWVLPNCCQWQSRPILLIESVSVTYWRRSTAVCVLMESIACLWLSTCNPTTHPTHSRSPTPITCHPWYYSCCEESCTKFSSVS